MNVISITVNVTGIVQGVGFRPYIFRLANELGLSGFVVNTVNGVRIEATGFEANIRCFLTRLPLEIPPAALLTNIVVKEQTEEYTPLSAGFTIIESDTGGQRTVLVSPDLDVCPACLNELANPADRRFGYPFINCTDCGPRYSIVRDLPYDRATTAMAAFPMCSACLAEYRNPASRRFHAEATCCPNCGPRLSVMDGNGSLIHCDPIPFAREQLTAGRILAIKGLGGFHLALDARNTDAVARLRKVKNRPDKPLAVMSPDLDAVRTFADTTKEEENQLLAKEKPVVLIAQKQLFPLARNLAPGNRTIGVMLPYTPFHHLLFASNNIPALVMTSGNRSGEPIVKDNHEALEKLRDMAEFFVVHDREIVTRIDDSVLRVAASGTPVFLRRARSFTPKPIMLAQDCGSTLALGGALKNTFCITRGREAFVSQHTGDLDLIDTQNHFNALVRHIKHILHLEPDLVVHDLHPDYPTTRMAANFNLATVAVQHHHAHAVSVMAEHGLCGQVIAVTLDGTGYGTDGTVWGGEVLVTELNRFQRAAHLSPVPMPGGGQAVKHPWRMACGFLQKAFGEDALEVARRLFPAQANQLPMLFRMLEKGTNTPLTSSCGRLFDSVAAMIGLRHTTTFEGQAAMELEAVCAAEEHEGYPFMIVETDSAFPVVLDSSPVVRAVVSDVMHGVDIASISARFHATIAGIFTFACKQVRSVTGLDRTVLSGGVFQNIIIRQVLDRQLQQAGFDVYFHRELPPNDACLSLGQALAGRSIFADNTLK